MTTGNQERRPTLSEDIQARLRRLRREGDVPDDSPEVPGGDADPQPSPAPKTRAGMPGWVAQRLRRKREREIPVPSSDDPQSVHSLAPRTSGEPSGLAVEQGEFGEFVARTTEFPAGTSHGDWSLDEIDGIDPDTIALLSGDPSLADLDLRSCVFLDTETTGLGGGAGVYVYMVGLGTFDRGRFRLWQGFLRSPREERALLHEAARMIRGASAVVSFFGKSFDRHRLDDKMAIAGVPSPFPDLPHLDLYHPFQRLTRKRLVDGRLATMESQLCGLAREDDLPGAFAPEAWFDFLAERPHRLEGVFRHNRDDVLSLVTLAAYLGRVCEECRVDGSALVGPAGARARGVARSHADRGDRHQALPWVERALDRDREEGHDVRDLLYSRGELLRQLAQHPAALEAFAVLAEGPADRWTVRSLVETSKILEHRVKDPERALAACQRAASLVAGVCHGPEVQRLERELRRREERLHSKLG